MATNLPKLSDLINLNSIPQLDFINPSDIDNILSSIYYKNYYSSCNDIGDRHYYYIDIVTDQKIEFKLGDTGMSIAINNNDQESTCFPVRLYWQYKILHTILSFKTSQFSFSPADIFTLFLNIFNISKEECITLVMPLLYNDEKDDSEFKQLEHILNGLLQSEIDIDEDDVDYKSQLINCIEQISDNSFEEIIFALIESLSDTNDIYEKLKNFFSPYLRYENIREELLEYITPDISLTLEELSVSLLFPREWLIPINPDTNGPYADENIKSSLTLNVGSLDIDTKNGISLNRSNNVSFLKSQIGNTGLTISFDNAKVDFSKSKNIPEAYAAGYPENFTGVYVERAEIGLPQKWFKKQEGESTLGIFGENMLIGNGGISGTIGIRAISETDIAEEGEIRYKISDGFEIGFKHFSLSMRQGNITEMDISGVLRFKMGNNQYELEVDGGFDNNGEFYISMSANNINKQLVIPGVMTYTLKSISLGKDDKGHYYLSTSGEISLNELKAIGNMFDTPISISELRIQDDGSIELKGLDGAMKLSSPKTLHIGSTSLTVTALHTGTYERNKNGKKRKYWYIGFDGGVDTGMGGVDARGDGIKLYFSVDDEPLDVFLRIESINVNIIIPANASKETAAALISGYLSMKEPESPSAGTEYSGGVNVTLPKLRLSASASLKMNPKTPSFLTDINISLPAGIPIGATGAAIYGFRGMGGQHYVATKNAAGLSEDSPWYEYYKAKTAPEYRQGITTSKMENKNGFSLGAGASIGTAFDNGRVLSAKMFFLLSLPEVILIEGQAAVLKGRVDLDTKNDPPFYAMMAISDKSIEAAFGADMKIPSGGQIAKIGGVAEAAFYFSNAGAWHLYIGKDNPESKRIRARILTLFNAYAYFMLDKQGIRTGAGANWSFKKKLGPVKISAGAYLDTAGKISTHPIQLGGSIALGGEASLKVFGFGLGIGLGAYLSAEAPKPFIIAGGLKIKLKLPWPIKKISVELEFKWTFDKNVNISEIRLLENSNVKAINIMTGDAYPVLYSLADNWTPSAADINRIRNNDECLIPTDSYIDVTFSKSVLPMKKKGGVMSKILNFQDGIKYTETLPPTGGRHGRVKHTYTVEDIKILSLDKDGQWHDYDVFKALTPLQSSDKPQELTLKEDEMVLGAWQNETPFVNNRLRIMARSPFTYISDANDATAEKLGFSENFMRCEGKTRRKWEINFIGALGKTFNEDENTSHGGALFSTSQSKGIVECINDEEALSINRKVDVYYCDSQASVEILLSNNKERVTATAYRKTIEINEETGVRTVVYEEVCKQEHTTGKINIRLQNIEEDGTYTPIDKISIEPQGDIAISGALSKENGGLLTQEDGCNITLEEQECPENALFIHCLRMLSMESAEYNTTVMTTEDLSSNAESMRGMYEKTIQPLWRPETMYLIKITTKDNAYKKAFTRTHNIVFRTAGPLGHFHRYKKNDNTYTLRNDYGKLAAEGNEDQYKLSSLKHYIDFDKSYPDASGKLINAKPMYYRNAELRMFYKYDYIYSMFSPYAEYNGNDCIDSDIEVVITAKDGTTACTSSWFKDPIPPAAAEISDINKRWSEEGNCIGQETISHVSLAQRIKTDQGVDLDADTLYTVTMNAKLDDDRATIHSFVFKTSRYADFEQHISSFAITDDNGIEQKQVYDLNVQLNEAEIQSIKSLLSNDNNGESEDKYEIITSNWLKIDALPPAQGLEVNRIIDEENGDVIMLLIRSDEPLNDPRIGIRLLNESVKMNNGTAKVFVRRDATAMIIATENLKVEKGPHRISFDLMMYDGEAYTAADTQNIEFDI